MKRIIITSAILGVALAALRVSGPALTAKMHQKCLEMFEGGSSPCAPKRTAACAEGSCSGATPADE